MPDTRQAATEVTQRIETLLVEQLNPTELTVIDESHLHVGHTGANSGGHFAVTIRAEVLQGVPRVVAHRKIYGVLRPLIPSEIHALSINLLR